MNANGKPVEDLAESYTFDKDTNTYTFKLRDGVKWHDGEDLMQRMLYTPIRSLQRMKLWEPVSPAITRTLQVLRHRMIRL